MYSGTTKLVIKLNCVKYKHFVSWGILQQYSGNEKIVYVVALADRKSLNLLIFDCTLAVVIFFCILFKISLRHINY